MPLRFVAFVVGQFVNLVGYRVDRYQNQGGRRKFRKKFKLLICTVRAPVFGTSEHYGKAHESLFSGQNICNYTICCWPTTSSNILLVPAKIQKPFEKNQTFNCVGQIYSAVYTGIKKPESFSHSGFSLKVARQLPLNTPKNPNRKPHLRSVFF